MKLMFMSCMFLMIFTVSGASVSFSSSLVSDECSLNIQTGKIIAQQWEIKSAIDLSWQDEFKGTAGVSIVSPVLLLGNLSRDVRIKALNGSYLTLKPQAVRASGMSVSRGTEDAVSAAFSLARGRYLAAHVATEPDQHLYAASFVARRYGIAVVHLLQSEGVRVPYNDWQSDRRSTSIDAYLLLQKRVGVFAAESYLKSTDDQIASKSHISVDLLSHHQFTFSRVVFSHHLHTWERESSQLGRREKLRYHVSYTGAYGDMIAMITWAYRSYRSLPFALHRGEEDGEFVLLLQWRSFKLSWDRDWDTDELGKTDVADTVTFSYKPGEDVRTWSLTASVGFRDKQIRYRARAAIKGVYIRTSFTVTYETRFSLSLQMHYAIEKEMWEADIFVSDQGLKAHELTIDL
ncbi:MAG: hypothetical protein JXK93_10615 [Sphaerochaetaceae bacterium]|nr:hypothetical protein [Sphaerochaetaceae bacterium]